MTSSHIKIIAIVTMVIDHIGLFFFPHLIILRYIGRIAFPLFAWLIANGAYHTRDIKKYASRIFILALVSQIPFIVANQRIGSSPFYLNVLFTLFLGLLAIYTIKKITNKFLWLPIALGYAEIANLLHTDYRAAGVLSIVAFYVFFKNKKLMIVSQTLLFLVLPYITFLIEQAKKINLSTIYMDSDIEMYGLLGLFFIFLYKNKKETPTMKYFFYVFYPLQYIVIVAFQILLKH